MHVVVLAAGKGSRLGGRTEELPKWLLPVGNRTIADRHLEGITRAGDAVASVRVVVGHAGTAIEQALPPAANVGIVANPQFAELNNWWSLLLALRELPQDGPVVVLNSDLLADPAHVAGFIEDVARGTSDGLLAVDLERTLTDESMKVRRDADGRLEKIGKVDVDPAQGEYVGMLAARGEVLQALRGALECFVGDPAADNEWYEGAVGRTAAAGSAWDIWPMPHSGWVEIDDDDDLDAAQALVAAG